MCNCQALKPHIIFECTASFQHIKVQATGRTRQKAFSAALAELRAAVPQLVGNVTTKTVPHLIH